MRLLLFLLGVFVAVICAEKPAAAQNGGWCAYYILDRAGSQHQQCLAAVSGGWRELRTQSVLPDAVLPTRSTGLSVLIALQLPQ